MAISLSTRKNPGFASARRTLLASSISLILASSASARNLVATPPFPLPAHGTASYQTKRPVLELLLIDSRVPEYQKLIQKRRGNLIPIVIGTQQDGLDVLMEVLTRYPNISALHLVSHGEDGRILFGRTWIDEQALQQRADVLHTLGRHTVAEQPDILLYGCEVANSEKGIAFVHRLGELIGFDVAASIDITGEKNLGGDWVLEHRHGRIDTRVAWANEILPGIRGKLATYTVSNLNDSGIDSLRQAIADANANVGPDQILFDATATGTIILTSGELSITDTVDITGPGADKLAISGNNSSRVISIDATADRVTLSGLTIKDGKITGDNGAGILSSTPSLTILDSVISGNEAAKGGGIFQKGSGGLSNQGNMLLEDSQVTGNKAVIYGGGISIHSAYSSNQIKNTIIANNTAGEDGGGLFLNNGRYNSTTIQGSTIRNNTADDDGGGIDNRSDYSSLSIINTTISSNQSGDDGAGFRNLGDNSQIEINDSTISNNQAGAGTTASNFADGGGILSSSDYTTLTIRRSTISGNHSNRSGGGIRVSNAVSATLSIDASSINNNRVQAVSYNSGNGGGLFIYNYQRSGATISNSTIAGNTASTSGGGLLIEEYDNSNGVMITNSTISGNSASNGSGGGVIMSEHTNITLNFVTIADNTAATYVGGLNARNSSNGDISHTIIAGNRVTGNPPDAAPDVLSNTLATINLSYTLVGDTSNAGFVIPPATNLLNEDPLLAALGDNGGPTLTHMPNVFSSPTIDAGSINFTPPPNNDQRGPGYARILSVPNPISPTPPMVDMGAVEITNCVGDTLLVPANTFSPGTIMDCHASVSLVVADGTNLTGNALIHYYAPEHKVPLGSVFSVELGSVASFNPPMFTPAP